MFFLFSLRRVPREVQASVSLCCPHSFVALVHVSPLSRRGLIFQMSSSLLQASTASASRTRSPSPALPGAWPPTPLHARSFTYPTLQSIPDNYVPGFDTSTTSPPLPDTRNLDHVLNFHKRLSQALASPLESAKLFPSSSSVPGLTEGVASSSRSVPSDDSDLTKYTTVRICVAHSYIC